MEWPLYGMARHCDRVASTYLSCCVCSLLRPCLFPIYTPTLSQPSTPTPTVSHPTVTRWPYLIELVHSSILVIKRKYNILTEGTSRSTTLGVWTSRSTC